MRHPRRALTGSLHAVLPDATLYVATATVEPVVLRIDACAVAAVIADQGVAAGRAAGDLAREGHAALVGVVADPRPVLAEPTGVTSPRRPRIARFRGGQIQQRPHREQDRDQPKDTSSLHGSLLSVVWSQQDGAAASPDVVTLLRYPVMEAGRPVEEA
jgi:hypothetical protein